MAQSAVGTDTSVEHQVIVRSDQIPERFDVTAGQTMFLPEPVLTDLRAYAERLDRSVGWCLWMAWCMVSLEMGEAVLANMASDPMLDGAKHVAEVDLPLGTWRHLTRMAERLDRSKSWLLARAWLLARPRFSCAVE